MTNELKAMTDGFAAFTEGLATAKAARLARRRELRGRGMCSICERPVTGMDFPAAADCAGFFGGEIEEGDGICFCCVEAWCAEPEDRTPGGRA